MGAQTHHIGSHPINGGSGGDALGSVGDASDHVWECLLALPGMDTVKGPFTAVKGPFTAECPDSPRVSRQHSAKRSWLEEARAEGGGTDDGNDETVLSRLRVRLGINEGMHTKKQRRASRARQNQAEVRLLDCAAQRKSELLNLRRLSELWVVGAVLLQTGD